MARVLDPIHRFFSELRRRNVYQVAGAYLVAGFVVLQPADLAAGAFDLPDWFEPMVWTVCRLGFPIALVLAWALEMTPEGVRPTPKAEPPEKEPAPTNDTPALWVGGSILVVLLLGAWWWSSGGLVERGQSNRTVETPHAGKRSIAVLPFEPLSRGEKSKTFARGVHDDLLTRLSKVSDLTVISRTSVERYRNTNLPLPAIADSLGVRWVMEGGVLESGGQIQVNAQLIDPRTDGHVWAEDYQRTLTAENLFVTQGEITREIAEALQAQLSAGEEERVGRPPTEDLEAYRIYVQGRTYLNHRTEADMRRAVEYFRRTIQRDSTYALAWVGKADALTLLGEYGHAPLDSVRTRARRAVVRALQLNPRSGAAHTSLALLHAAHGRGPAAIRKLKRAVELRPNYAEAHNWLSWYSYLTGHPQEGLESAQRAAELDPLSPEAVSNVALGHLATGNLEKALSVARRSQEIQSGFPTARLYEATALHHLGRLDDARRVLHELEVEWAKSAPRSFQGLIDVASGDSLNAQSILRDLRAEAANQFYPGLVQAMLGNRDSALETFRRIDDWGRSPMLAWPNVSLRYLYPNALGPLRNEEEYEALIREINRSWGLNSDGSFPEPGNLSRGDRPPVRGCEMSSTVRCRFLMIGSRWMPERMLAPPN